MGCSVGFKNALAAGAPPWTPLGKLMHDAPPDLLLRGKRKGQGAMPSPQTTDNKN